MAKRRNKLARTTELISHGLGHGGLPIINAMAPETDRGCALVAAEFLSDSLELYIRRIMERRGANEPSISDFLLNLNAPLGNFSPRIKAAFWFGLIGPRTYRALEDIREIRNHCAHRAGPIDFQDTELASCVHGLEEYLKARAELDQGQQLIINHVFRAGIEFHNDTKQRRDFMVSVMFVNMTIRQGEDSWWRYGEIKASCVVYGHW